MTKQINIEPELAKIAAEIHLAVVRQIEAGAVPEARILGGADKAIVQEGAEARITAAMEREIRRLLVELLSLPARLSKNAVVWSVVDAKRKDRRLEPLDTDPDGGGSTPAPAAQLEAREELEDVAEAIGRLSESDRQVLEIAIAADQPGVALAAAAGASSKKAKTAARTRVYAMRQRLREALAEVRRERAEAAKAG